MDSADDDRAAREVRTFASAVVHELRTPLSALSAEVDIALRRDRPAAAYREALGRIQRRVAELAEFGCDLAWLAQPLEAAAESGVASLDALLASVVQRSSTLGGTLSRDGTDAQVHGDEQALNRGIWLLVEHAMRYRLEGAAVRISVGRTAPTDLHVFINITAAPPGFAAGAWDCLRGEPASGVSAGDVLRLRAASRIVREFGGTVETTDTQGVMVRLRRG